MFWFFLCFCTGHFNRSVRLWAKKHGWKLTDSGLVPQHAHAVASALSAPTKKRAWHLGAAGSAPCVERPAGASDLRTEADIFAALGLQYRTPAERNVDGAVAARVAEGDRRAESGLEPSNYDVAASDAAHRAQKKYP